jgi:hypothetical protein
VSVLIGARARVTIHAEDGTPHAVEGEIVAVAAQPGPSFVPREAAPWPCLVLIRAGDVAVLHPANLVELEILPTPEEGDQVTGGHTLGEALERVAQLDEENAELTVKLRASEARELEVLRERDVINHDLETLRKAKTAKGAKS